MDNVVFSQIDFGLFMPLLENDDITDISYSNSSLQTIESVSMSLIYYFDFSNYKDNFQKQIYDNLGNDPLSFDLNIEVI